jgi:hypothetical protein
VKISFNSYIAILIAIALIGILFVPAVSAGKIINYGPIQGTIKTIPVVNYTPTPAVVTPKTIPFIYLPSKWPNTILPNPTSDNGGSSVDLPTPSQIVTPTPDPSYISKDQAIQIALNSFINISLTSDPIATLTIRKITHSLKYYTYTTKEPVWVVELSGVSTDPNAFGSLWYRNGQTGELIFVPTHAGGWVTIDAINGKVLSVDRCM